MRPPARTLVAVAATVVAVAVAPAGLLGSPVASASAPADPVGACTRTHGAVVAVDFGHWGGPVARGCDPDPTTGMNLLHTGFDTTGTGHDRPGFVCRIGSPNFDGGTERPAPAEDPCTLTPPITAYWSFWIVPAGQDSWTYSPLGALADVPADGEVEATGYLTGQLTDGDHVFDATFGSNDYVRTAQVGVALAGILAYLAAPVTEATHPDGPDAPPDPAATSGIALLVEITGGDPRDVGGQDLVAALAGHVCTGPGSLGNRTAAGDFFGAFTPVAQATGVLALARAGAVPAAAVDRLTRMQCAGGGFPGSGRTGRIGGGPPRAPEPSATGAPPGTATPPTSANPVALGGPDTSGGPPTPRLVNAPPVANASAGHPDRGSATPAVVTLVIVLLLAGAGITTVLRRPGTSRPGTSRPGTGR